MIPISPHGQGAPGADSASTPLPSILLIEDNSQWADIVARVVTPKYGFGPVARALNMEQAKDLLAQSTFGLVLLDLNLPDSRGLATLTGVRVAAPQSAILIMTGDADQALALQAIHEGAQDYMVKGSLNPEEIRRACRYALERQAIAQRFQDSAALLTATLNALPACIAILDGTGIILARNTRWSTFIDPRNPLVFGCVPDTNYLAVLDAFEEVEETARGLAGGLLRLSAGLQDHFVQEYATIAGEGRRYFEFHGTAFQDHEGIKIVVFHLDMTERRRLEERLRVSDALFTAISENVPDLLAIVDSHDQLLYTSPSFGWILGYSMHELKALPPDGLRHPEDQAAIRAALDRMFTTGQGMVLTCRLRHKEGHYVHFESNGTLIGGQTGPNARALIVARDVSERVEAEQRQKEMEIQLRQAQKLESIGQLAAGIAHEINTPTQYIGDNTAFVRKAFEDLFPFLQRVQAFLGNQAAADPEKAVIREQMEALDLDYLKEEIPKALDQGLEGVARVSAIVSAMKTFSHPGGAKQDRVDLNKSIQSTITVSRNEWKYVADLETDFQPDLPLVPCYTGEFNQVVLNLIVNAAHAITDAGGGQGEGSKGLIRISTRLRGNDVEIRISDTGTGIPPEIRSRVFDPFFTTKAVGKGTGQSLAIAHLVIVEKHRGQIDLESEMGKGTTFILRLPLNPDRASGPFPALPR